MVNKILVIANMLVTAILWIFAFLRYKISPDFIPLHYTIYFGLDRFGPKHDLFLFPTLGLFIFMLNFLIIKFVIEDNKMWRKIIYMVTLFMQIILLVSFVLIVLKDLG